MVNMSKRQPHRGEKLSQGHPMVCNERRGNPPNTGQAAAAPKTPLYTGTAKELPPYTQATQKKQRRERNKTYIGQKFLT